MEVTLARATPEAGAERAFFRRLGALRAHRSLANCTSAGAGIERWLRAVEPAARTHCRCQRCSACGSATRRTRHRADIHSPASASSERGAEAGRRSRDAFGGAAAGGPERGGERQKSGWITHAREL